MKIKSAIRYLKKITPCLAASPTVTKANPRARSQPARSGRRQDEKSIKRPKGIERNAIDKPAITANKANNEEALHGKLQEFKVHNIALVSPKKQPRFYPKPRNISIRIFIELSKVQGYRQKYSRLK
jgi:hypothetical protein